ncbi:MAG: recombinase RecT [Prevotella sp.]|nr:recombinase RecT [Massilibacteroides sp.]
MPNLPATNPVKQIKELLNRSKKQIAIALPKGGPDPETVIRQVMTNVQKNPSLLNCDHISLIGAVIEASQLGLPLDGVLGHAYIIPFKGRVQLIPGYKGLMELAYRSGRIEAIHARIIYDCDEWEYEEGLHPILKHKPSPTHPEGCKPVAVYARAKLVGAEEPRVELLWAWEVEKIKNAAPGSRKNGGPWETYVEEMWKKTAIRRLCKFLPQSPEIQRMVALDEMHDAGISQHLESVIDAEFVEEAKVETAVDSLKEQIKSDKHDEQRHVGTK